MSEPSVRPIAPADLESWAALFRAYRDFYAKPHDPAVIATVWGWLMDPDHPSRALVAEQDDRLVGIAHFRSFPRPIDGGAGLYLDDLFTDPASRGGGVGTTLLHRLSETARAEGASLVRWITAADNAAARRVYDREARRTDWVTYDLPS